MKLWPPFAFPGPDGKHRNADPALNRRGSWPDARGWQQVLDNLHALAVKGGQPGDDTSHDQIVRAVRSQLLNYCIASGTANALTITLDPAPASWNDLIGVPLNIKISTPNTGPATLAVTGLPGTRPIVLPNGVAVSRGDLGQGRIVSMFHDGAAMQLGGLTNTVPSGVALFSVPGATSWVVPPGVYQARPRVWGAGAGGGGVGAAASAGRGGGGGGYSEGVFPVIPGESHAVIVGAGGVAGSGGTGQLGGNGGTSSVGSLLSATGGIGGQGANGGVGTTGGTGGTGTGGFLNVPGTAGSIEGQTLPNGGYRGGAGGAAFGTSGQQGGVNGAVAAGNFPGGGGTGAATTGAGGFAGGAGANGLVIIEY